MQEEINLQEFVSALLKRWYWIVMIMLLFIGLGAVGSFLLPTTYETTATISLPSEAVRPLAYPRVTPAKFETPEIEQQLIAALASNGVAIGQGPSGLTRRLRIDPSTDNSTWSITAQFNNGEGAAKIANVVAEFIVKDLNQSLQQNFKSIDVAKDNLQDATDALQSFVRVHSLAGYDLYALADVEPFFLPRSTDASPARMPESPSLTSVDKAQLAALLRAQDVAAATYFELALDAAKRRVRLEAGEGVAQVVDRAAIPQSPATSTPMQIIALSTVVGLMAGVFGVLFFELSRRSE